ncbi:MAG: lipopolysaccharide biosynthesis protein [Planctomycetota bacterium]
MSTSTDSPIDATHGGAVSGLGQTIKSGAGWTIAARFGGRVVRMVAFFVLAKLLGPKLLGVVGTLYVIDPLTMILSRLGTTPAIIQKKDAGPDHFDSAMIVNVLMGLVVAVAVAAVSPLIGRALDDPLLAEVLLPYTIVFAVRALSFTPEGILRRRMAFRTFAVMGEFANAAGCTVMIILAFNGRGVWSVFWAELLRAVLLSGLFVALCGHRFRLRFRLQAVREMVGFSGWATVTEFFYYGACNIFYIVVRVALGSVALGLYVFAFRLISQPLEQIAMRLYEVMFPAFSRYQDKPEDVLRVQRKLVCAISLFALPFLSIAAVLADEFFAVLMGPKWAGAVLPFQILCAAGMIRVFVGAAGALIRSRGHIRFEALALAVVFILMGIGTAIGTLFDLPGVAVAVDIVTAVYLGLYLVYQGRKTEASVRNFFDAVWPGLHCALASVAVCVGTMWLLVAATGLDDLARLLIAGACAIVACLVTVALHPDPTLRSVVWELTHLLRRRNDESSATGGQ